MRDHQTTERPVMHWVAVEDDHGRTHLEARWSVELDGTRQQAPRSLSARTAPSRAATPTGSRLSCCPGPR